MGVQRLIVKKYEGENRSEIFKRIREELGEEAVILKDRKVVKGGMMGFFGRETVEIIAAAKEGGYDDKSKPETPLDITLPPENPGLSGLAGKPEISAAEKGDQGTFTPLFNESMNSGTEKPETEEMHEKDYRRNDKSPISYGGMAEIKNKNNEGTEEQEPLLRTEERETVRSAGMKHDLRPVVESEQKAASEDEAFEKQESGLDVTLFFGPAGSGKSSVALKLAWKYSMVMGEKVMLVCVRTSDNPTSAGLLRYYWKNMQIELREAQDANQFNSIVSQFGDFDTILIDTEPYNPRDKDSNDMWWLYSHPAIRERVLVVDSCRNRRELQSAASAFPIGSIDATVLTKVDETSSFEEAQGAIRFMKKELGVSKFYASVSRSFHSELASWEDALISVRNLYGSSGEKTKAKIT